jgi:hypothetical protein
VPASQPDDLSRIKIFPRNLTARADYVVRGNPPTSRPESGVDNCFPGLEFDQRNLDQAFFPGLRFEFHRGDGAILVAIAAGSEPERAGLREDDLRPPLYLWALIAPRAAGETADDRPVFFHDQNGLEVWRRVHDLAPGRLAILLVPQPGVEAPVFNDSLATQLTRARDTGQSSVRRDGTRLAFAILAGDRARYLDDDGVIDPASYAPGDLTRSLCAPWQYDFRDCGCFYWAATKPDLVSSADGTHRYLNFQRRDHSSDPPPQDVSTYSSERRQQELDYAELIGGAWNDVLPIVVNDRESERFAPPAEPDIELMSRDEVIHELEYLATVEHALCVEYLYAHYSLDAPMALPSGPVAEQTSRIFAAATEVFNIAVDEMRHLRWANEALNLLGAPPSVGRAERIGRQLNRPFALEPLTPQQLEWFIQVEEPSQTLAGVLDGMYVRLQVSIDRQPELFPERERLIHLIKLIIDEGQDHFERFTSIQQHLAGLEPDQYLRTLDDPSDQATASLQDLSDQNYAVVLGALQATFSLSDRAGGILIEHARRAMFNLHETNHFLAARGVRARFTLPVQALAGPLSATSAHTLVDSMRAATEAVVSDVSAVASLDEESLAHRQLATHEELFDLMDRLIDEDMTS